MSEFKTQQHNHLNCIKLATRKAIELCERNNLRFTPIRKRVFMIVWRSHAPISAYDILAVLREDKSNAEAPTVYRALDFLLAHRLIHKLESFNAFVGCTHPGEPHVSQFLICQSCNQTLELQGDGVSHSIEKQAIDVDFIISQQTIEISGFCPKCQ